MLRKEWYTTGEVAEMLGYTSRWVRRRVEEGELVAHAYDGSDRRTLRIHRSDLEAFRRRYIRDARELPPRSER